jgi:16S rRNA processing protein RimM
MMVADDEKIVIGKILRPHGVKGYARVLPVTDNPGRFRLLRKAWLRNKNNELIRCELESVKLLPKAVLLKLKEIDTIEDVDRLRECEIVIDRQDCLPLENDAYYVFDLIGCEVFTTSGKKIGIVEEVLDYPASDVFVIRNNGQEMLIPAVAQFIKKVDIESSTIIIEPIEGLLQ